MRRIPFVPFPLEKSVKIAKPFLWLSNSIVKTSPFISQKLMQAGIDIKDRDYISVAIFSSIFWSILIFAIFNLIGFAVKKSFLGMSIGFSILFAVIVYVYIYMYPSIIISKKNRDIEKNVLFAIRHLFIQVKSGVTLFDSMVSVARSNYGIISEEFSRCTKEIATGKDEIVALEEMAFRVPNISLKRIIWQIVNSLKAGGDIGNVLSILAQNLSAEQKVAIRKYGAQLSPMALMYLMTSVILPTLGITFIIIFSTFSGFVVPETFFYLILFLLTIFQFVFIGLVKSRRPSVEI